jgi:hypothetical protein
MAIANTASVKNTRRSSSGKRDVSSGGPAVAAGCVERARLTLPLSCLMGWQYPIPLYGKRTCRARSREMGWYAPRRTLTPNDTGGASM